MSLLAFASCSKPEGDKPVYAAKATMKAISFNIRHTGEASDVGDRAWDARKAAVVNMLSTEAPDFVGFQECTDVQLSYLKENLAGYGFYAPGNNKVIAYNRNTVDCLSTAVYWLSETPNKASKGWDATNQRATAWIKVREKTTGSIVYFFDTHLDVDGKTARIEGAKLNVEQMKLICGNTKPQIIVGDMNTNLAECLDHYTAFLGDARADSPETDSENTYNAWGGKGSVIDYIYYRNTTPICFKTLNGEDYGVKLISDHYPVMYKFEIKSDRK